MRTSVFVIVLAVAVIAWLPTPASAQDGDVPGACVVLGGFFFDEKGVDIFSGCIDGVSESFCLLELCGFNPGDSPDGGGGFEECFFTEGKSCTDQPIPWDGACEAGKGICALIASDTPGASQALCKGFGQGTWLPGATQCGGAPVPAMPKAAYAALALVLLGGTLALLTIYSRS